MALTGANPLHAYAILFRESLLRYYGIGNTLTKMAPLLLAACGVLVALRAGQLNISGEGQIHMGGLGAALVGLYVHGLPIWIHIPLALANGFLFGAIWGGIAGYLKAFRGVNEVITTVINIGLEGMLLSGAFAAAIGALFAQNVWVGVLGAIVAGGIIGLLHAYLCVSLRVNQLVSGFVIGIPILQDIPILGTLLFHQDVIFYLLLLLIGFSTYLLFFTGHGLALRAVGEYPKAADASGINVAWVRYISVIASGCLAGLGGAYLTLGHVKFFTENISAGKGFIALAALIFGRWHPVGTVLACLWFGAGDALQLRIQALNVDIPYQFLTMLPYCIALMALVGLAGKSAPPTALGIPYIKESAER